MRPYACGIPPQGFGKRGAGDEQAEFEHSDTRFDDPFYDLPELMIALDLSL